MTVFPVIVRELQAESRRPFTYWLRVLAAGALLMAVASAMWRMGPRYWRPYAISGGYVPPDLLGATPTATMGALFFGNINAALFLTLWIVAPLLTAGAIRRERREGTLGLLFLTPLSATSLVVGKSFAHILRSLSVFLTMIPWLMLPVLLGGVGPNDALLAALLDLGALCLGVAAGLLASSFTRDQLHAVLSAELLSFIFALAFMSLNEMAFENARSVGPLAATGASSLKHDHASRELRNLLG